MLDAQRQTCSRAAVLRFAPRDGSLGRGIEDSAFAVGVGLQFRGVVDLLEDSGDRQNEVRLKGAESRYEIRYVAGMADGCAGVEGRDGDGSGEDVRERKEHQGSTALVEKHFQRCLAYPMGFGEQIGVCQLHPSRPSRCSRGVDQRCRISRTQCGSSCSNLVVGDVGTELGQLAYRPGFAGAAVDLECALD